MAELTYSDATAADIAGIQSAARESWRATYRDILPPGVVDDFVARNYAHAALYVAVQRSADIFLVAKDRERVVGFCHLGDRGGGPEMYRLYLVPECWGHGTGSRLLALLEQRLRERGITGYRCFVHKRNERAKSFYARRGFVHDSTCDDGDDECLRKSLA